MRHGKIPEWYNDDSKHYDKFNEDTPNARITNSSIERILAKHKVKTVADFTCGTGSQLFYLAKRDYEIVGSDISPGMLKVAKRKTKTEKSPIPLKLGDVRTIQMGKFDAALTIFNAIGHLTKAGFEKAMRNIRKNLNEDGIYLFDIFNLDYIKHSDNISKLTIDWMRREDNTVLREIQYSVIDNKGILSSHTTSYEQKSSAKAKVSKTTITLQLYTAKELKEMLERNGFKVLEQCALDGSKFSDIKTERILTVAQKIK